jgi:hypothetical protein
LLAQVCGHWQVWTWAISGSNASAAAAGVSAHRLGQTHGWTWAVCVVVSTQRWGHWQVWTCAVVAAGCVLIIVIVRIKLNMVVLPSRLFKSFPARTG